MLIREEAEAQHPVYYTSEAFLDVKTRYQPVEKYALALMALVRKLRPYFQAYPIEVLTNLSLRQTLHKLEASKRLVKRSVELNEYDISYRL